MNKWIKWRFVAVVVVLGFSLWSALPLNKKINLGLDLRGGMHLVMKVDTSKLPAKDRDDAVERAVEVIGNRIDSFGVKEPSITRQGTDEIVLQLPGVTDRKRAISLIGKTAQLEFKLLNEDTNALSEALKGNVPDNCELLYGEDGRAFLVYKEALLKGDVIKNAYVGYDSTRYNEPVVNLELNSEGAKKFAKITGENVGKRLAIVLDKVVKSAPVINQQIPNGRAIITGMQDNQEASDLAIVLRVGALPAPMKIVEERTVGPLLGRDSIRKGIKSAVIGAVLIFIFMIIYYGLTGFIADIALLFNVIIILGGLGFFHATLTLPGIAGIILTLGMAVDANVLINERIREELSSGNPLKIAIRNGYDKAFVTILDSNLTTLIAAFMLFQFGTGPIRGFAVTLSIGLLASMFSAIVFTRLIAEFLFLAPWFKQLKMLSILDKTNFDFLKARKIAYFISLAIILIGGAVFFSRGRAMYGIDFAGGYLQEYKFATKVPTEDLRAALKEAGIENTSIQRFRDDETMVIIKTKSDTVDKIQNELKAKFSDASPDLVRVERVGPSIGKFLKRKAILAVIWSLAGILVYVGLRFHHFNFAAAAVTALLHDVFVVIAFLAFTGRSLDLLIVTALLTIAGYSVNDTIVIYDRVREKMRQLKRRNFYDIINIAINETLGRTIITSLTTAFVVLSIYLFGGEVLNDFAFALLIGIITGTYSTIFIASPLVLLGRQVAKK